MMPSLRILFGLFVTAALAASLGCDTGTNARTGKTADTRSAAQYFKDEQVSTMTPNGKIKTDSVQEKDGEIHYKTEDGKKWRVRYSKRSDGTYEYSTPEEVR
jgi:hypothetical protein